MKDKQSGAVLIIGLILLTVMTIVVVAGMESAIVNEKISYNHQAKETLFQLVDSGGPIGLEQKNLINDAFINPTSYTTDSLSRGEEKATLELEFNVRPRLNPGFSTSQNTTVQLYMLDIKSTGKYLGTEKTIHTGYVTVGAR